MCCLPAHLRLRISTIRRLPTAKVDRSIRLEKCLEGKCSARPRRAIDFLPRSNRDSIEAIRDTRNIVLAHERWRHDRDYLSACFDREAANVRLTAKRVEGSQIAAWLWHAVAGCQ
jgi:hypothetical protein